jgi:hypothetical protein
VVQSLNSSYERGRKAEDVARHWLERKFSLPFSKRSLQVGLKSDGKPALHSFDLVSEDGQIVAEVKSHQLTRSGNVPSGKISDTYSACLMLEKAAARMKLLVLTDYEFYEMFRRYSDGKIHKEIEIIYLAAKCQPPQPETMLVSSMNKKKEAHEDFKKFWSRMTDQLSRKQHIVNWTADKGETGEDFQAEYVSGNYVIVYLDSRRVLKVPMKDFKIVYDNWDDYLSGIVTRSQLVAESRFTKYTISIIRRYLT